jgi:hypothetical protein
MRSSLIASVGNRTSPNGNPLIAPPLSNHNSGSHETAVAERRIHTAVSALQIVGELADVRTILFQPISSCAVPSLLDNWLQRMQELEEDAEIDFTRHFRSRMSTTDEDPVELMFHGNTLPAHWPEWPEVKRMLTDDQMNFATGLCTEVGAFIVVCNSVHDESVCQCMAAGVYGGDLT